MHSCDSCDSHLFMKQQDDSSQCTIHRPIYNLSPGTKAGMVYGVVDEVPINKRYLTGGCTHLKQMSKSQTFFAHNLRTVIKAQAITEYILMVVLCICSSSVHSN